MGKDTRKERTPLSVQRWLKMGEEEKTRTIIDLDGGMKEFPLLDAPTQWLFAASKVSG